MAEHQAVHGRLRALCRNCGKPLARVFCDLGASPLANDYKPLGEHHKSYSLKVFVCDCGLVQLENTVPPGVLFNNYHYFSSVSAPWVKAARDYAERMIKEFDLGERSLVVEVGSNDGYLLQHFKRHGIPVIGIEPADNIAKIAIYKGIHTKIELFGMAMARDMPKADLIVCNNVLAHVPDIHNFIEGFKLMLKPEGTITFEFPHLRAMVKKTQFDTVYHEHHSYLSLNVVDAMLLQHHLCIYHVEKLPTFGGSYRLFVSHVNTRMSKVMFMPREKPIELAGFQQCVDIIRDDLMNYLHAVKRNKYIIGYSAPAKATTMCVYCGITVDLIDCVIDDTPAKQGCCIPGTGIPIFPYDEEILKLSDVVLVFAWNWAEAITKKLRALGYEGEIITAIPRLRRW